MRVDRRLTASFGIAILVVGIGAVGSAGAGGTQKVKTKMAKLEVGPDGASGKVKASENACVKKRKVKLKGPEPFDPNAGPRGLPPGTVLIGKDKTNKKGRWSIDAPDGGFLNAGDYQVIVTKVRLRLVDNALLCLAFDVTLQA